jgi:hypothetical protein
MSTRLSLAGSFFVLAVISAHAQTAGWPDTIDRLVQERSQAQACVDLLKSASDRSAIQQGQVAYGGAKAAADGVVAGFTIALVEGYKPQDLPTIQANLELAGAGLEEVCNDAIKAARASEGSRSLVSDAVTALVGPAVDALKAAAGALWAHHVEMEKLEMETIKGQLEAARWPDF